MTTRDPYRGLVMAVSNTVNGVPVSAYHYTYDALGRAVSRDADTFGYNPCSELTSAAMGTNAYSYAYDGIGNALWTTNNSVGTAYQTNPLNQYTNILRDFVSSCEIQYDQNGNLTNDNTFTYAWDGENRLIAAYNDSALVVSNAYDHQSRRVLKITPTTTHTFLYDGWNLVQETIATATSTTTNHYIWGKDLSGTLQGAGGIGGLVAVIQGRDGAPSRPFFPLYDNNGNITAYVDESGIIVAEYRYDAFGNTIAQSGLMANTFPHRFSTKYFDTETGLYYYGYRFYSPVLMRWLNRDPVEEVGGLNLYVFIDNAPVREFDYLGLIDANSSVAEIEAEVRKLIAAARKKGLNVAADNLDNFLNSGGDRTLSAAWLRGFDRVLDAEIKNQKRFERDLRRMAKKMKNGDTKRHQDYWDALISYGGRGFSTEELFWASGDSTLTSRGDFSLTASACEVKISGNVDHKWHDEYDWHPGLAVWIPGFGTIPDAAIDKLRTQGHASTFDMDATWSQHLEGTVKIYLFGLFSDAEWKWTGP